MWNIVTLLGGRVLEDINWKRIVDSAAGLHLRAAPNTAAHVVSALNDALPADRERWTTQSLYTFIASFAKVERDRTAKTATPVWIRPPAEIVAFLLRGARPDSQNAALEAMLLEECDEVFATLPLLAQHERDLRPQDDRDDGGDAPEAGADSSIPNEGSVNGALPARILKQAVHTATEASAIGPKLVAAARNKISEGRRHGRDRRIAAVLLHALRVGGLRSRECRETLLALGLDAEDVDHTLRTVEHRSEPKPPNH